MEKLLKNLHWYILGALFAAAAFIWYAALWEDRAGLLTVAFLDVGQGDAIFIEAPGGNQVLIDASPNASVLRGLGEVMPFYDHSIDLVVATHPDADHIGGFPEVFRRFRVGSILESGARSDTGLFAAYDSLAAREAPRFVARRGMRVTLGSGAFLDILFPDRALSDVEPNSASIIATLVYGDTSFLFTGDAPKAIEEYVASLAPEAIDTDVLKVGHHGSRTSTSEALVGLASPLFAVISAGRGNRYGHPHGETLETLRRFDVPIFGTYDAGRITFVSDGRTVRKK